MKTWGVACIALLTLAGCSTVQSEFSSLTNEQQAANSNQKPSKEAKSVARLLGISVDRVRVSNISRDITGSIFDVEILSEDGKSSTRTRCSIVGGSMLHLGITSSPICGDAMWKNPFTGQ